MKSEAKKLLMKMLKHNITDISLRPTEEDTQQYIMNVQIHKVQKVEPQE